MLKNIQKQLNLIYLNNEEHTHMDRENGRTDLLDMVITHTHMDRENGRIDLLDMVITSPNLAKHDIQLQIGDDFGSDHLPIEISIDAPPHRNSFIY